MVRQLLEWFLLSYCLFFWRRGILRTGRVRTKSCSSSGQQTKADGRQFPKPRPLDGIQNRPKQIQKHSFPHNSAQILTYSFIFRCKETLNPSFTDLP